MVCLKEDTLHGADCTLGGGLDDIGCAAIDGGRKTLHTLYPFFFFFLEFFSSRLFPDPCIIG